MNLDNVRGMFLPLLTPFDGNGGLDEGLLADLARYAVDRGVQSLFLFGSFGQGPAMSIDQRKRGLEIVLRAVGDRLPVIPQIGAVDPYTARDLALHARAQGVPAIGAVGPYYYTDRSEDDLVAHFRLVDEAAQLPFFLYNNPAYQGYSISLKTLQRLKKEIPRAFGLKMAKGSIDDVLKSRAAMGPDFKLFAPAENLYPGLLAGLTGSISPPLNLAIELGVSLCRAVDAGDHREAERLQLVMFEFLTVTQELNKYGRAAQAEGMRHLGFALKQYPRWPTANLPSDARDMLYRAMDRARDAALVPA